jgi:hypothetical protein
MRRYHERKKGRKKSQNHKMHVKKDSKLRQNHNFANFRDGVGTLNFVQAAFANARRRFSFLGRKPLSKKNNTVRPKPHIINPERVFFLFRTKAIGKCGAA